MSTQVADAGPPATKVSAEGGFSGARRSLGVEPVGFTQLKVLV
jgi:hypothetical protein